MNVNAKSKFLICSLFEAIFIIILIDFDCVIIMFLIKEFLLIFVIKIMGSFHK
jgi:hypothetical protein